MPQPATLSVSKEVAYLIPKSSIRQGVSFAEHEGAVSAKIGSVTLLARSSSEQGNRFSETGNYAVAFAPNSSSRLVLRPASFLQVDVVPDADLAQTSNTKDTRLPHSLAKQLLGETFGSKRKKKLLKLDAKSSLSKALLEGGKDSTPASSSVSPVAIAETTVKRPWLPAHNEAAAKASEIYDLQGVIPEGIQQCLAAEDFEFQTPGSISDGCLRSLVISIAVALKEMNRNKGRFISMEALGKQLPPDLLSWVQEGFFGGPTTRRNYEPNALQQDRMVCYFLILLFHGTEYRAVDCEKLAHDLKISLARVKTYLKAVGCRISTNGSARLQVPPCS